MMDTMTMQDLSRYEDADTPETATEQPAETADAVAADEPKKSRRRGRWVGPSAYSLIAAHLEQHGSITQEEAKKLHDISYSSFHSTIYSLNHDGWLLRTSKVRNEAGSSRTRYHLVDENETQEAGADSQPALAENRTPPTKKSNTVAVRIGENGLEVQLTAKDDMDTAPFYTLTQKQIEYLATNFRLYQNLVGEK